jgi:hypothetical protein
VVIDAGRAAPTGLALTRVPTHRVGDVTGSAGIEAAFRAARQLATELSR